MRITTSKDPATLEGLDGVEVRRFNFLTDTDYGGLVAGCDAIIHIAAETLVAERMLAVNAQATEKLAKAAEQSGVKAFCHASSVAVYGSGRDRDMSEDAPVLTADRDVASEYWVKEDRRTYGRSKLAGELALRRAARSVGYVVMRPTSIVGQDQILGFAERNGLKKALLAHRHTHHVLIEDVADALVWGMQRALSGTTPGGSVETFNLSEDDHPEPTYADIMAKAYATTGDARYKTAVAPSAIDRLAHLKNFNGLPLRKAFWEMRFPNDRLRAAGYRFKVGMREAERTALAALTTGAARAGRSHVGGTTFPATENGN